jgi:hypothetical protein
MISHVTRDGRPSPLCPNGLFGGRGGVLAGVVGVGVGVAAPLALGFFLTSSNDPIADIFLERLYGFYSGDYATKWREKTPCCTGFLAVNSAMNSH